MKFEKWSDDKWLSKNGTILPYDKLEHFFLGTLGLLICFYLLGFSLTLSFVILELLGIAWEIKDGIVPYDDKGNIEGFSWKDLIADNIGFLIGHLFTKLFTINHH
jgi:hypothetical protein